MTVTAYICPPTIVLFCIFPKIKHVTSSCETRKMELPGREGSHLACTIKGNRKWTQIKHVGLLAFVPMQDKGAHTTK